MMLIPLSDASDAVTRYKWPPKGMPLRRASAAMTKNISFDNLDPTDFEEFCHDLLIKLGREDDAYDACALIVPEWDGDAPPDPIQEPDDAILDLSDVDVEDVDQEPATDVAAQLAALPMVTLRSDLVPDELSPARFFAVMLTLDLRWKCRR